MKSPFFTPSTVLPNDVIAILASLPSFTKKIIKSHLRRRWQYWEKYGDELSELLYVAGDTITMDRPISQPCERACESLLLGLPHATVMHLANSANILLTC